MVLVLPHSSVSLQQLCHCLSRLGSLHYLVSREELPSCSGLRMFEFIGRSGCKLGPSSNQCFKHVQSHNVQTQTKVLSLSSPAHLPISTLWHGGHSWAPSNHGFKLATLACFIHNHLGNHLHNNLPQQAMPWLDQLVSTQPHAKRIEATITRDTRKFFHPSIPSSKFGNGGLCDCPWDLDS